MNSIENALRQTRPREPSPDYVERGLARLVAGLPQQSAATRQWRFAAVVLAVMLAASMALNAAIWSRGGSSAGGTGAPASARLPVEYVAYSMLRSEGEFLVHEVRFGTIDEVGVDHD